MALKIISRKMSCLLSTSRVSFFLLAAVLVCKPALAHHWFQESHDIDIMLTMEVEVIEHRFINPHPFFSARVIDVRTEHIDKYGDQTKEWQLQMDNRHELQDLGFDKTTLLPGDKVIVSAHPGSIRKNILYVKVLEHPRLGFRYEHNVRQLIKLP